VVQDDGVSSPVRPVLNFTGDAVTLSDDAAGNRTTISITGGTGGTGVAIISTTPPAVAGLPEGTWWVDEDSDVPPFDGTVGHTIQDEGTALTARAKLNFIGAGVSVTDDAANNQTKVTIDGGSGGGGLDQAAADTRYVNVSGDTMTGGLTVSNGGVTVASGWITSNSGNTGGLYVEGGFEVYHDPATMASRPIGFWRKTGGTYQPLLAVQPYEPATKAYTDARTPNIIVLGPSDPVPGGTPAGTVIIRTA